ncbi:hypothetical protein SNE40_015551 [Patella caerulea]|uniref:G-protein coupled receptors family 1 profile domain-containing protein n=1 Tax=Patella caerulea TaxID=87958 RepID=A0AAN8JLD4_PATCE
MCGSKDLLFVSLNYHCVTKQDFALNLCLAILGIFIILINLLAVVTLVKHTDLQEPTNYFIANLAAADMAIGIFVVYDFFYNILQFKFYIECVLRVGLFISVNIASVFNLTALTYDRYLKITKPYLYIRAFTMKKVKIAEASIWIGSLVCGMLPFFGWSTRDILEICNFFGIMSQSYLIFVLLVFTIPSGVITVVYIIFMVLASRHRAAMALQMSSVSGDAGTLKAWKSFKTTFIIVGAYFLCWGPVGTFTLIVVISDIEETMAVSPNVIFTYLLGFGVLNSILNPIIYATKISVFRRKLFQLFCIRRLQQFKRASFRSISSVFRNSVASNTDNPADQTYGSTLIRVDEASNQSQQSQDESVKLTEHTVEVEKVPDDEVNVSDTVL